MSSIIELNEQNFNSIVENGKRKVVVDFWAPWCGPCRMQIPILEKIANDPSLSAIVAKLNVDEYPSYAMKYGVSAIPTIIIFNNGKVEKKLIGVQPEHIIRSMLN
ncbi:MAG: thioredoxin [Spirochaetes bacterium]|nr:thioredoxin [Spirochaetota bacterium]